MGEVGERAVAGPLLELLAEMSTEVTKLVVNK